MEREVGSVQYFVWGESFSEQGLEVGLFAQRGIQIWPEPMHLHWRKFESELGGERVWMR